MRQHEHFEAVRLVQWWAYFSRSRDLDQRLLMAIPNGGQRHVLVAAKMKAEGVRRGAPDYFLAVPRAGYHGLFVELKKPKGGRVSPEQKEMMGVLLDIGYLCVVANGAAEGERLITEYLDLT